MEARRIQDSQEDTAWGTSNKIGSIEMHNRQGGFSLIELLIVVAIILIIAAIAIPNFLRSRISANESSAVTSLRTISTAQITYAATYPEVGFAADLTSLAPPAGDGLPSSSAADLIDPILGTGLKSGYGFQDSGATDGCSAPNGLFNVTAGGGVNIAFEIFACPLSQNRTGIRNFCADNSGVIRRGADPSSVCDFTVASPPIP